MKKFCLALGLVAGLSVVSAVAARADMDAQRMLVADLRWQLAQDSAKWELRNTRIGTIVLRAQGCVSPSQIREWLDNEPLYVSPDDARSFREGKIPEGWALVPDR